MTPLWSKKGANLALFLPNTNMISIPLNLSYDQNCSYLPMRKERLLFVDSDFPLTTDAYAELAARGFRRSGNLVYRPHCSHCSACLPVRVPASQFRPSRIHRRICRSNSDLVVTTHPAGFKDEHYSLYKRYLESRHPKGTMITGDTDDYLQFLTSHWCETEFVEFNLSGKVIAVAIVDILPTGLSAVYTFYDPDLLPRSLGIYAILWEIEYTKEKGLPWLYLGYWVQECRKMSYKGNFRPMEVFRNDRWILLKKGEEFTF